MLIEATALDFEALLSRVAPRRLRLVDDSAIAAPEVLAMLSALEARIRVEFDPSAWMIVESDEVIGLCSVTRSPRLGVLHIGFGVAPSRQGKGTATRAIGMLLAWARHDPRVLQISAETGVLNIASQRVLHRNGFVRTHERVDAEDGPVICWEVGTA